MVRILTRSLVTLGALYLLACLVIGIPLAELTLHTPPRPIPTGERIYAEDLAAHYGATLQSVTLAARDGAPLVAWYIAPHPGSPNAVILLHGVGDNRASMAGFAPLFLDLGYAVLMPDARGHGESGGGVPTFGERESADIHAWANYLRAQQPLHCLYGLGESMGAAQLLQSLGAEPGFCAVIAESPFATFREVAYDRFGQFTNSTPATGRYYLRPAIEFAFLYARLRYGVHFDTASPQAAVARTRVPVLLIHGTLDSNIPLRHCEALQHANPQHVALWQVPGARHTESYGVAPEAFRQRVQQWLTGHPDAPGGK